MRTLLSPHATKAGRSMARVVSAFVVSTLLMPSLLADPITILNPSFEFPDVASLSHSGGVVDDWDNENNTGVFNAGEFGQDAPAVDEDQIAYFNVGDGILRQTLAAVYAAGTDYTLTVWVSPRVPDSLNYDLDLVFYGGNDQSNEISRTTIDFSTALTDVFIQVSATATAAQVDDAGAVGQAIRIAFENANGGATVRGVDFDLDVIELMSAPAEGVRITDIRLEPGSQIQFSWASRAGKVYDLLSSLDPENDGDPATWPVVAGQEGLAATPPSNMRTIPLPGDDCRLYVIRERDAPPVFSDDLETVQSWSTGPNGGDAGNTVWERGAPGNFVSVGLPPLGGANGSTNCFGTNLSADYGPSTDIYLRSPSIDLTTEGLTEATLTLYHYLDTEFSTDDVGSIRVLKASDFSPLGADLATDLNGFPNNNTDWQKVSYALPAAALGETIVLEFQFVSDADEHYSGWYIDEVEVTVN